MHDDGLDMVLGGFLSALLVAVFVIGSAANVLLLVVFYRRPALRNLSNRFVLSLVAANLVSTFLLLPLVFADVTLASAEPQFSFLLCHSLDAVISLVTVASILSTICIGVDRYFGVLHPLRYHERITKMKSIVMITSTWVTSFVCCMFDGLARPFKNRWNSCEGMDSSLSTEFSMVYVITAVVFVLLVPLVVKIWIYAKIYNAAHQNVERARRNSLVAEPVPVQVTVTRSGSLLTRTGIPSLANRVRHRISNASMFYREEGKAAKMSMLIVFTFLICWFQYFLYGVINVFYGKMPKTCHVSAVISILIYGALSSYMYAFHRKKVMKEVRNIFSLCLDNSNGRVHYSRNLLSYQKEEEKKSEEKSLMLMSAPQQKLATPMPFNMNDLMNLPRGSLSSASASSNSTQSSFCPSENEGDAL